MQWDNRRSDSAESWCTVSMHQYWFCRCCCTSTSSTFSYWLHLNPSIFTYSVYYLTLDKLLNFPGPHILLTFSCKFPNKQNPTQLSSTVMDFINSHNWKSSDHDVLRNSLIRASACLLGFSFASPSWHEGWSPVWLTYDPRMAASSSRPHTCIYHSLTQKGKRGLFFSYH